MANNFTFIGKISGIKPTDSFAPIDRPTYDSGWTNTIVKFNCISGTNRIMCMTQGGKWLDDSKNITNSDGTVTKGEKIEIPWAKRNNPEEVNKVSGFRRFIVDTGDREKRKILNGIVRDSENNKPVADKMKELGYTSIEEVKEALESSYKKRHAFITEWDFAEFMAKVVVSEKIKDATFKISGTQEVQYAPSTGRFYVNYKVNRVELATAEDKVSAKMFIDFYFDSNYLDESDFVEQGKAYINGYTPYYDSSLKKGGYMPITTVVRDSKKLEIIKKRLSNGESEIKNIGIAVDVINGSEFIGLTYDDLDEETKEDVDCGMISLKDALAALGGNKIGERIAELRYCGWNAKKNKAEDTSYTKAEMKPATMDIETADDDDADIL